MVGATATLNAVTMVLGNEQRGRFSQSANTVANIGIVKFQAAAGSAAAYSVYQLAGGTLRTQEIGVGAGAYTSDSEVIFNGGIPSRRRRATPRL